MISKLNKIDTKKEFNHLFSFLEQTWVFDNNLDKKIIFKTLNMVYENGLNFGENFCSSQKLDDLLEQKIKQPHEFFLEQNYKHYKYFDGLYFFVKTFIAGKSHFRKKSIDNFQYDKIISELYNKGYYILKSSLFPKTYDKHSEKSYNEVKFLNEDFFESYHKSIDGKISQYTLNKSLFNGYIFENISGFDFIASTALHYILESDINQGRSPLRELISAIFRHGINVSEYNNVVDSINFFDSFDYNEVFYKNKINVPNIPFIKACLEVAQYDNFEEINPEIEKGICLLYKNELLLSDDEILIVNNLNNLIKHKVINSCSQEFNITTTENLSFYIRKNS